MSKPVLSLTGRALRFLSRREHSRQELRKKLLPYAQEEGELDAVLDKLEQQKFLSNERYAHSVVRRKSERYGSMIILESLKQHGLGKELVEQVKEELKDTELQRLYELWVKKYGELPEDAAQRAKQTRYLVSKGFPLSLVNRVVAGRYEPTQDD